MNRRSLLTLTAGLIAGAPALRAYSFLINNPLAGAFRSPLLQRALFSEAMHPNDHGYKLVPSDAAVRAAVQRALGWIT